MYFVVVFFQVWSLSLNVSQPQRKEIMKTILSVLFIGFGLAALVNVFGASVCKQATAKTSVVQAVAILPGRQRNVMNLYSKGKKPIKPDFPEPKKPCVPCLIPRSY